MSGKDEADVEVGVLLFDQEVLGPVLGNEPALCLDEDAILFEEEVHGIGGGPLHIRHHHLLKRKRDALEA
jgi:hypothetical protein